MPENRIILKNQIEKSVTPGSLIVTDANNKAGYLAPGDENKVIRIVDGIPQYANESNIRGPVKMSGTVDSSNKTFTVTGEYIPTATIVFVGRIVLANTEYTLTYDDVLDITTIVLGESVNAPDSDEDVLIYGTDNGSGVNAGGGSTVEGITENSINTLTNKTLDDYSNKIHADGLHARIKATEPISYGNSLQYVGFNAGEQAIEVKKRTDITKPCIGVSHNDLATGSFGMMVSVGLFKNIDTITFPNGTILYPNTSGGFTDTPNIGNGNYNQPIAYVVRSHHTNGEIMLNVHSGHSSSDLISFNNSISGLSATNVKTAIDELSAEKANASHTHAISDVTGLQTALDSKVNSSLIGQNSGIASLDSTGKVPSTQLPAFVDDVLEFANLAAFPTTGEAGKIYVALDTNITYRWSGTVYVEISSSLALGETSSTAYRGDRGKTAYDHSQITGNPHGTTKSDVGLGNVPNLDTTTAVSQTHTHSNKTLLDSYTQTEVDLADAVSKKHSHANLTILNSIQEALTTALKSAYDSASTWVSTNGVNVMNHLSNTSNPHSVTKSQVGLANVDNTSDANKPVSTATQTALNAKEDSSNKKITMTGNTTSDTFFLSAKAIFDWASGLFATQTTVAGKENTITAGTTSQYWRGDKSWQTLDKTAVGLGNVDNTSDSTKNSATAILTNKEIVRRVNSQTSVATLTPAYGTIEDYFLTAQAVALTIANPTGTPKDGEQFVIRIKDNGTARTIAFGANYRAVGITLPTTTVASKTMYLGCKYNAAETKVDIIALAQLA